MIYKSQPLGIKLKLPLQWEVMRQYSDSKYCFDVDDDRCTEQIINDNPRSGNYSFNIIISKEFFNGSLKNYKNYKYNELINSYGSPKIVDDKEIILKSIPALQIEYTEKAYAEPRQYKSMKIHLGENNTFYEIRYIPNIQSDYYKFLPEVQNILNTIEFIFSKPEVKVPSFPDAPPEI